MAFLSPPKITTMEDARRHRKYALFILMIVYAFNFIDRQILNILQTPIKEELGLSDTQLGLLTGFSFTLVYITVGIAVAKLADSTSRKGVVTVSLAIWSGFTAISGLAQNYIQLLLYRLGVGVVGDAELEVAQSAGAVVLVGRAGPALGDELGQPGRRGRPAGGPDPGLGAGPGQFRRAGGLGEGPTLLEGE